MAGLLLLGLVHSALAARTGIETYAVATLAAWTGVLLAYRDRTTRASPALPSRAAGIALLLSGLAAAAFWSGHYAAPLRATALLAGSGFLLFRHGLRSLRLRELGLLSLPLITPWPKALVEGLSPERAAMATAAAMLDLAGAHATVSGDVLSARGGAIQVVHGCCGFVVTSQLLAVAAMLVFLFEMPRWKQLAVLGLALVAGFLSTCCRLAVLTLVSRDGAEAFEWWHGPQGTYRFTLAALAFAGFAWWLIVRERKPALREVAAR